MLLTMQMLMCLIRILPVKMMFYMKTITVIVSIMITIEKDSTHQSLLRPIWTIFLFRNLHCIQLKDILKIIPTIVGEIIGIMIIDLHQLKRKIVTSTKNQLSLAVSIESIKYDKMEKHLSIRQLKDDTTDSLKSTYKSIFRSIMYAFATQLNLSHHLMDWIEISTSRHSF